MDTRTLFELLCLFADLRRPLMPEERAVAEALSRMAARRLG